MSTPSHAPLHSRGSEVLRWPFEAFRLEVRTANRRIGRTALSLLVIKHSIKLAVESTKLVGPTTGDARTGMRPLLVRAPGRVRTASVHGSAEPSRSLLVFRSSFIVPRTPWSRWT